MPKSDGKDRQQSASSINQHDSVILDKVVMSNLLTLDKDKSFLSDLVQTFIRDGNALLNKLDMATKDDYDAFRDSMHALKGNAGNLGAISLHAACKSAEHMTLVEYQTHAVECLNLVRDKFNRTIFLLHQVLLQQNNTNHASNNTHSK